MQVAFLPVYPNPYQHLLRDALAAEDVEVTFLDGLPTAGWLRAQSGQVRILHFHWLDGLYMKRLLTPLQVAHFVARFRLARRLGYRVVWTAHNILPHRTAFRPLDVVIRRLMMAEADAVIAHCEYGRHELLARFPRRGPLSVIPFGHYGGLYPVTMTREEARAALGLRPGQFVYLSLGNIARYKGLEQLCGAFTRAAAPDDVLLIAGRNRDAGLVKRLMQAASGDERVRVHARFVPDEEMQRYLLAADVMVAPFERILTSSSVMVGLSHNLPVIAPRMGCLPELITPEAGLLYEPDVPDALAAALAEAKRHDLAEMGAAAGRIAAGLQWNDVGRRTATVYREILGP